MNFRAEGRHQRILSANPQEPLDDSGFWGGLWDMSFAFPICCCGGEREGVYKGFGRYVGSQRLG